MVVQWEHNGDTGKILMVVIGEYNGYTWLYNSDTMVVIKGNIMVVWEKSWV